MVETDDSYFFKNITHQCLIARFDINIRSILSTRDDKNCFWRNCYGYTTYILTTLVVKVTFVVLTVLRYSLDV